MTTPSNANAGAAPADLPATSAVGAPSATRRQAVILRADIVGFTAITEDAVSGGLIGAERLAVVITRFIDRFAEIATHHGGQVAAVAGDAVTAVWTIDDQQGVQSAAIWAARTAILIHAEAKGWQLDSTRIRLRSAISWGELDHFVVGHSEWGWYGITSGPALAAAVADGRSALPDQIVISHPLWEQIRHACKGAPGDVGTTILTDVVIPMPALSRPSNHALFEALPGLTGPLSAADRLALQPASGEFRRVSVIFSQLRHPFYAEPNDALTQLQEAARRLQNCVGDLEGSIYTITADENVTTAVSVFGLVPWSHEDDATRAVEAALRLHDAWSALSATTSSGIATGRVFCTAYGRGTSRVSAIIGPTMNLAARLMQTSQGVVCDDASAQASRRHHRFEVRELAPSALKGAARPVTAFVPIASRARQLPDPGEGSLIGRKSEIGAFEAEIRNLQAGRGGVRLVDGQAGVGKSTLVGEFVRIARLSGVPCLIGVADPTERQVAYSTWRGVYQHLLADRRDKGNLQAQMPAPADVYVTLGDDALLAPLLNDILQINLGDTLETSRLIGEPRFTATRDLLVRCMARATRSGGLLVVIEDLHWIDPSSFSLLIELAESGLPLLMIATERPPETTDVLRERLLRTPNCIVWTLRTLTEIETGQLLAQRLGTQRCEPEAADLIQSRTGGNPLFIEEIAPFLQERGILTTRDGGVSVALPAQLANVQIDRLLVPQGAPGALESVVLAKFDRLTADEQMVLRAVSVLGAPCDHDQLRLMLPDIGEDVLTASTNDLIAADFLTVDPNGGFAFKHVLLRDVIYNSISFADRRRYHRAVAKWLARATESRPGWSDAVVAHHYRQAGDYDRAVEYLFRAGERALSRYANLEAANLLADALELDGTAGATGEGIRSRMRTVEITLGLARANLGLSRYADTKRNGEAGLALLGFPVPASSVRLVPVILSQIGIQVFHRLAPRRRRPADPYRRADARAAATALEGLTEAYFYRDEAALAVYASLRTLNLAERWRLLPQQARGYATLAGITSLTRLRRASAYYRRRALETLDGLEDPAASVWVYIVVGLSLAGLGQWEEATSVFFQAAAIAEAVGDRRRWRDARENIAAIAACQGNWQDALTGVNDMQVSADRDKDQRYQVLALREQAFYLTHLAQFDEAKLRIDRMGLELENGITAEEGPTRQDLHALRGTLALEFEDLASAQASADAALREIRAAPAVTSFPFTYWNRFLVARIYLNLLRVKGRDPGARSKLASQAEIACRALEGQGRIYPIAAPAALLCRGTLEWLSGHSARAWRKWNLSADRARRLSMEYELSLAEDRLAERGSQLDAGRSFGLTFFSESTR